jgi:hypothetical protein
MTWPVNVAAVVAVLDRAVRADPKQVAPVGTVCAPIVATRWGTL